MGSNGKDPMDQLSAHLDRGWDLVSRGDFAAALLSARKGLEVDAESPEAHNLLGYIQAAEGRPEDAIDHYRKAIDLDDTFVEAMLNAAEVLVHPLGDHAGALRLVDDALELMDDDEEMADALLLKVDILMHTGDREQASHVLSLVPEGPFENPGLRFLVGRARFEVGDVDGAEPLVRDAVEQNPPNAEAYYYLGLILEIRKDLRAATVAFLQCRELDLRAPPPPWSMLPDQFEKRVRTAIGLLPVAMRQALEGALVVVGDLPGAEVVADGVDPRLTVLLDDLEDRPARVGRVFIYQRNVERAAASSVEIDDEVLAGLGRELEAAFSGISGSGDPPAPEGDDEAQGAAN